MIPPFFKAKLIACTAMLALPISAPAADQLAFFESQIRPVLVKHCYECHSGSKAKAGLRLDYRGGWEKGGDSGPAIQSGKIDNSLLLKAIRHQATDFQMPKGSDKLPDEVISAFETWIARGATDPRNTPPSKNDAATAAWKETLTERSRWWSLLPPKNVTVPTVNDAAWKTEPVDRFILSALDKHKLTPSRPANAQVLLRRVSLLLTGLPPKESKLIPFQRNFDRNPDEAMATLTDELLSSPHFGERVARHWMDVVRYTDTYGYEWDSPAKGSWEYRDYLIRSFNLDVGFDQIIREQIAGDLLPKPRINKAAGVNESIIGPMFYHMGEHRHGTSLEFNGIHQEMVNNKIDTFSKAFLAMTVGCARCHDHKLDAISQNDYYALAGVFMSPRWTSRVIDAPGKNDAAIAELKSLRKKIKRGLVELWANKNNRSLYEGSILQKWASENHPSMKDAKPEDLAFPLTRLLGSNNETILADWAKMASTWHRTHESRLKTNTEKFTKLTDFDTPGFPENWIIEGDGIIHGYVDNGTPLVSLKGDTLLDRLLPRGYHTNALSSKLPGAIRLPAQDLIPGHFVSLKLRGGEWAGHLEAPQNAFQSEAVKFFDPDTKVKWLTNADRELKNGVTRVLTEIATSSLNPDFPPRTGKAKAGKTTLPPKDDGFNKRSWFSLTGIVTHETNGAPENTLKVFASLYSSPTPTTMNEAWQRIADWHLAAIDRWASNEASAEDVKLINWMLEQKLLSNEAQAAPTVLALVKQYRETEARINFPRSVNSMEERGVAAIDYRLNVRGNVNEDGPAIHRDFLEVFSGKQRVNESKGSGRLELAQYLSSRNNPQTARVYVNRVWRWVFGAGIVSTPNDFGKLGGRPSNPELLDWLAIKFMEEGWSTKKLIRRLILSQTFRQSGEVNLLAVERDPDNTLLHHYPTRRLEAETIRDSLLAVSGRLDPTPYGPPINPPRPAEDANKRLFSGPIDSKGKRSIYLKMSIMDPPRFLVGFNLPDLKLPTGRRDVTNVPSQALILLNGPLATKMAEHWAKKLVADQCKHPTDRIRMMFVRAFGRPATTQELERWTKALNTFSKNVDVMNDQNAWTEIAHALFNTKEFIYYR